MKKIDISDFLFHALFPIIVGSTIGFMLKDFNSYVDELNRSIKVPNIVFPIVWSILYLLIGVWYHFFAIEASRQDKILYYIGLFLNFLFSPVLFYFQNIPLALIITILLVVINVYLLFKSIKYSKLGYLLIPYVLWLIFATILMFDLLVNNIL